MEQKEWGKPNIRLDDKQIDTIQQSTSLMAGKPTEFRSAKCWVNALRPTCLSMTWILKN